MMEGLNLSERNKVYRVIYYSNLYLESAQ